MEEAGALFPIDYRNREAGIALKGSIDAIPPDVALHFIDRMLLTDPGSAKFNYLGAVQELRRGSLHGADKYFAALRRLTPDAREVKMIQDLYGAVQDGMGGP